MAGVPAPVTELPPTKDVRDLLEGLLGKDVEFSDGARLTGALTSSVGVYVDDLLVMRALVVMDLPMAATVGAAIGLMPPVSVEDAVEDGQLLTVQEDNAAEVLNIMASLFNVEGAPHVRFYGHHAPGDAAPPDVAVRLSTLSGRVDWRVSVKGYPSGLLSIITVD